MTVTVGHETLASIICALAVLAYAAQRYNTPETNRHTTTRMMFYLSGAGYVLASFILFLILSWAILSDPGVLGFLGLDNADNLAARFSAPVLAALVLTALLPNAKVLRVGDSWLLKRFQAWGRIPYGARSLADKLTAASLPIDRTELNRIKAWVRSSGDIPTELERYIGIAPSTSAAGMLTRLVWLHQRLVELAASPEYAGAFRWQEHAAQQLQAEFGIFMAQSHAFFVLFDHLGASSSDSRDDARNRAEDRYKSICEQIYRHATEFLAVLLLRVEGSDTRIADRLRQMGFALDAHCPPVSVGPMVFVGCMLAVLVLALASVAPQHDGRMPLLVFALLLGFTQTVALAVAVVPKLRFAWFREDSAGNPPYLAWITSAVLAGLLGFLIDRAVSAAIVGQPAAVWDFVTVPVTPRGPMAAATAFVIAAVCDLDMPIRSERLRRVVEGILCGAFTAGTIFVCLHLLQLPSATKGHVPSWLPFLFAFGIGFVSGSLVPHVYRRDRSRDPGSPKTLLPPVGLPDGNPMPDTGG